MLKKYDKARDYLDRTVREFPDGDPAVMRRAGKLMQKVIAAQAAKKS